MEFTSVAEAELYLENQYANKLLRVTYYTQDGKKEYVGKLDRIAVDIATKRTTIIILIFNDNKRFEIDKDDFNELVEKLN